jgi:hypothetical protein
VQARAGLPRIQCAAHTSALSAERSCRVLADQPLDPCARFGDLAVRIARTERVGVGVGVGVNVDVHTGRSDSASEPLEDEVVTIVRGGGSTAVRALCLPLCSRLGSVACLCDVLGNALGFLQRLERPVLVAIALELHGLSFQVVLLLPQFRQRWRGVVFVRLPARFLPQFLQERLVLKVVFGEPHIRELVPLLDAWLQ